MPQGLIVRNYDPGRLIYNRTSVRNMVGSVMNYHDRGGISWLKTAIRRCKACTARPEARCPVTGWGNLSSEYVIIGRNPGMAEDLYGQPFYPGAPCGKLLDSMLDVLGITREDCYITNAMFCHTARDRKPLSEELFTCSIWKTLELRQLSKVKYIFLLGTDTLLQFFGIGQAGIIRVFTEVFNTKLFGNDVLVVPCYHPGFMVRKTELLPDVARFLDAVRGLIEERSKS